MKDFTAEDRVRIGTALNYNTREKMNAIELAMKRLQISSFDLVYRACSLLDEIEECQGNLNEEMGSSRGSMIKAGPLEWSQNRFTPIISLLRLKVQSLGVILDLEPDFTVLDTLSKQYGLLHSATGRLGRS